MNAPLTLDQIRFLLQDRRLSVVARETGVSYSSLWRIVTQPDNNPSYINVEKLSDYFRNQIQKVL